MAESVTSLKKKLDAIFSKYIRLRDALITTGTKTRARCITCGKVLETSKMDAGHWRSRGMNSTRYDERNVHAQCKGCNGPQNGRGEEFRRALVGMYGEKTVEEIYQLSNQLKQWKVGELQELLEYYKEEYKEVMAND